MIFTSLPKVEVEDEKFHLRGANPGKALKIWLDTLKWPTDVTENDA